jgi:N-acetylmuramate 1-kinase
MAEANAQKRLESFLTNNGHKVEITPLTPDASTREYFRVPYGETMAIACVYPNDEAGKLQFKACEDVTNVFRLAKLPVAEIYSSDENFGVIIHEDFGDVILRDVLQNSDVATRETYINKAITLIAEIQSATQIAFENDSVSSRERFDEAKLSKELDYFKTHYFETFRKSPLSEADNLLLTAEFTEISKELADYAKVLTHRDFHAANMMVFQESLKIIDHQDARIGSTTYDLVSLLLDRVTDLPTAEWLAEKRKYFLDERERLGLEKLDEAEFAEEFRLQTIQRCLKAIGTFSFQSANRGKTRFDKYIIPMFQIVLRACENLNRFPNLQRIIGVQINEKIP